MISGVIPAIPLILIGAGLIEERILKEARDYYEKKDMDAAYGLITANLRLVVKIALDFQRYWMQNLLDLIQEGNIGLMQAVKKFDPYREIKFGLPLVCHESYFLPHQFV